MPGRKRKSWDMAFKREVVQYIKRSGKTCHAAAIHFKSKGFRLEPQTIRGWLKNQEAILGLGESVGVKSSFRLQGGGRKNILGEELEMLGEQGESEHEDVRESGSNDPLDLIDSKVKVFWPDMNKWYTARVKEYIDAQVYVACYFYDGQNVPTDFSQVQYEKLE